MPECLDVQNDLFEYLEQAAEPHTVSWSCSFCKQGPCESTLSLLAGYLNIKMAVLSQLTAVLDGELGLRVLLNDTELKEMKTTKRDTLFWGPLIICWSTMPLLDHCCTKFLARSLCCQRFMHLVSCFSHAY